MPEGHRVLVTFTEDQYRIIRALRGVAGSSDADVVRTIFTAWLLEHRDAIPDRDPPPPSDDEAE